MLMVTCGVILLKFIGSSSEEIGSSESGQEEKTVPFSSLIGQQDYLLGVADLTGTQG